MLVPKLLESVSASQETVRVTYTEFILAPPTASFLFIHETRPVELIQTALYPFYFTLTRLFDLVKNFSTSIQTPVSVSVCLTCGLCTVSEYEPSLLICKTVFHNINANFLLLPLLFSFWKRSPLGNLLHQLSIKLDGLFYRISFDSYSSILEPYQSNILFLTGNMSVPNIPKLPPTPPSEHSIERNLQETYPPVPNRGEFAEYTDAQINMFHAQHPQITSVVSSTDPRPHPINLDCMF